MQQEDGESREEIEAGRLLNENVQNGLDLRRILVKTMEVLYNSKEQQRNEEFPVAPSS